MSRQLGFKHTEETKRKISEKNKGKIKTKEHLQKLSESAKIAWINNPNQGNKGCKRSKEHSLAISKANKGKSPWNKGITGYSTSWKGQKHTDTTKKKMSDNHLSKTNPELFKKINDIYRPRNPTIYEQRASEILDKNNIKYITQYKIKTYCCDFYIPELNLILEIDGYSKTSKRKQTIIKEGYNLLHVWNKNVETIMKTIFEVEKYESSIIRNL